MVNKVTHDVDAAVADIPDGATLMVGGFGLCGHPARLLEALARRGSKDLTVISNNAGSNDRGLGALIMAGGVRTLICSFPVGKDMWAFKERFKAGQIELKLVPQGTLAERIRAGGSGLGGFLTRVGLGTELQHEQPVIELDGEQWLLERPLRADFALVKADRGDRWGNLCYRLAARNFNPLMAMAARVTVAETDSLVELNTIPPDDVHTPGVFVNRVVPVGGRAAAKEA